MHSAHFFSSKLCSMRKYNEPALFFTFISYSSPKQNFLSATQIASMYLHIASTLRTEQKLNKSVETSCHQPRTLHLKPFQPFRALRLWEKWHERKPEHITRFLLASIILYLLAHTGRAREEVQYTQHNIILCPDLGVCKNRYLAWLDWEAAFHYTAEVRFACLTWMYPTSSV